MKFKEKLGVFFARASELMLRNSDVLQVVLSEKTAQKEIAASYQEWIADLDRYNDGVKRYRAINPDGGKYDQKMIDMLKAVKLNNVLEKAQKDVGAEEEVGFNPQENIVKASVGCDYFGGIEGRLDKESE